MRFIRVIMSNTFMLPDDIIGITFFPFIIMRKSYFDEMPEGVKTMMINHEKIHVAQQKEMLVVFFYLWYFIEWAIRLLIRQPHAYRNISFEAECYAHQKNPEYLKTRKRWAFMDYL